LKNFLKSGVLAFSLIWLYVVMSAKSLEEINFIPFGIFTTFILVILFLLNKRK